MFRAEQMASLPGTVTITPPGDGPRSIVNESGLDLKDAWVVRLGSDEKSIRGRLGRRDRLGGEGPARGVGRDQARPEPTSPRRRGPDSSPRLVPRPPAQAVLRTKPEEVGELRLIAWADKPLAGQAIDPPVDRQPGVHPGRRPPPAQPAARPGLEPATTPWPWAESEAPDPLMKSGDVCRTPRTCRCPAREGECGSRCSPSRPPSTPATGGPIPPIPNAPGAAAESTPRHPGPFDQPEPDRTGDPRP